MTLQFLMRWLSSESVISYSILENIWKKKLSSEIKVRKSQFLILRPREQEKAFVKGFLPLTEKGIPLEFFRFVARSSHHCSVVYATCAFVHFSLLMQ